MNYETAHLLVSLKFSHLADTWAFIPEWMADSAEETLTQYLYEQWTRFSAADCAKQQQIWNTRWVWLKDH